MAACICLRPSGSSSIGFPPPIVTSSPPALIPVPGPDPERRVVERFVGAVSGCCAFLVVVGVAVGDGEVDIEGDEIDVVKAAEDDNEGPSLFSRASSISFLRISSD